MHLLDHISLSPGRTGYAIWRWLSIYLCLFSMFLLSQNLNNSSSNIHGFGYHFAGPSVFIPSISSSSSSLFAEAMEEFHVFEPMELHDAAVDKLVKMRKENPKLILDKNSPFMIAAREEAIKRFRMRAPEVVKLSRYLSIGHSGSDANGEITTQVGGLSLLTAPDATTSSTTTATSASLSSISTLGLAGEEKSSEGVLSNAVSVSQSQYSLVQAHVAVAEAVGFSEDIGGGAISKAGGLPVGDNGEWMAFAEEKLQKENDLDYQQLLWELGTSIVEKKHIEAGGQLNISKETELLDNMKKWFISGGGQLKFVEPVVNSNNNMFKLKATEDIGSEEVVLTVPMKLTMCQQTARNILIHNKGKYLGEELSKTFEKDPIWGLSIFLLHEYYKDKSGIGSKWGPFIKMLRMRSFSTEALGELRGTMALELLNKWTKNVDDLSWFASGSDGPCSPSSGICKVKPRELAGETRFNIHQLKWAYWVVKQNAIRIRHATTGFEFIGLVPFYSMLEKKINKGGGVSFDFDGSINIRSGESASIGESIGLHPGDFSDSEYFLRYMKVPADWNNNTILKLSLPGTLPKGSKFHYCTKGTEEQMRSDDCKGSYRSDAMFWKSKVLGEWRKEMNLPPRMQELRKLATNLHLYGGKEEMKLLSASNRMIAGLPIPTDQMPAEEQLMFLGIAKSSKEAALMVRGTAKESSNQPPPQLYAAPDPEEDPEAKRNMESLAFLAAQTQAAISSGNTMLNATRVVLNATRDFFLHGAMPSAGLDELDNFLLKKIGLLSHCGFENDMKIVTNNITKELFCAMRVHLMNESEVAVFCPANAQVWEDACLNVEFMNYTAISFENEIAVVATLKSSINMLLSAYPTTLAEDWKILDDEDDTKGISFGEIKRQSIRLRIREKELLFGAASYLDGYDEEIKAGNITFQIIQKQIEREKANIEAEVARKYVEDIRQRALERSIVAFVEVNMGDSVPKKNITLLEGNDIKQTVVQYCKDNKITDAKNIPILEKALRDRVQHPAPLQVMIGVSDPNTKDRRVFGLPSDANVTVETEIFCARYLIPRYDCKAIEELARKRVNVTFQRKVLLVVPVDAPDSRKLKLVIFEGEQHDLLQVVTDFFIFYKLSLDQAHGMALEVEKRLPKPTVLIPISGDNNSRIVVRFTASDNVTNVVEAFVNRFDKFEGIKTTLVRQARYRLNPGSFLVPEEAPDHPSSA